MRNFFWDPFRRQLAALLLLLFCAPTLRAGALGSFFNMSAGLALFGASLVLTLWNPKPPRPGASED